MTNKQPHNGGVPEPSLSTCDEVSLAPVGADEQENTGDYKERNCDSSKAYDPQGEDLYVQFLCEEFFFGLGPLSVATYGFGYCLSACYVLWYAKAILGDGKVALLRLTHDDSWSLFLIALLIMGAITCLYLRARNQGTYDVVDGMLDGMLAVGLAVIPTAVRVSPLVPIAAVILAVIALFEARLLLEEEMSTPWPEPWLPVATRTCAALKRLSGISIAFVVASVSGLI